MLDSLDSNNVSDPLTMQTSFIPWWNRTAKARRNWLRENRLQLVNQELEQWIFEERESVFFLYLLVSFSLVFSIILLSLLYALTIPLNNPNWTDWGFILVAEVLIGGIILLFGGFLGNDTFYKTKICIFPPDRVNLI